MDTYIPFCGSPPLPAELWTRWTFEPSLIAGLLIALGLGLKFAENRRLFWMAWALVALLFVSPICAASMALFSVRVAQHIVLTLVAAPLLAAALPRLNIPPMGPAMLFAAVFWVWHAPAPYQATLESDPTYWAMHLSLFGSALALFCAFRHAPERSVFAATLTAFQLTLFAAMLALASAPWHPWHLMTTAPYGLSASADQQLAGAAMWVAGGGLFLAQMARMTGLFLSRSDTTM